MGSLWAILLFFWSASAFAPGAMAATFTFINRCREPIYPGVQTNPGKPGFSTTGFDLKAGGRAQYSGVPGTWAGRIWPRHRCTAGASGALSCASGDCGGKLECNGAGNQVPSTLAEFTLGGAGGKDFFDISNVDGFNVPLQIGPHGAAGCRAVTCAADINAACPSELVVKAAGGGGTVVGCKSACVAFNTDEYCCRGRYGSPGTCKPSRYSQYFKRKCPQAYSYAFDDGSSTFTCAHRAAPSPSLPPPLLRHPLTAAPPLRQPPPTLPLGSEPEKPPPQRHLERSSAASPGSRGAASHDMCLFIPPIHAVLAVICRF